jgi:hypothetical protein
MKSTINKGFLLLQQRKYHHQFWNYINEDEITVKFGRYF